MRVADGDNNGLVANTDTNNAANSSKLNDALSPWADDVPEDDEESQEPQVVGTLYDSNQDLPAEESFSVPENTQDKVLNQVAPEQYATQAVAQPIIQNTQLPTDISIQPEMIEPQAQPIRKQNVSPTGDIRPRGNENTTQRQVLQAPQSENSVMPAMAAASNPSLGNSKNSAINPLSSRGLSLEGPETPPTENSFLKKIVFYRRQLLILLSLVGFVVLVIVFTEIGQISIGAEKAYGYIRMERLWGGLSKDTRPSLAIALSEMSKHQTFKVRGSVSIVANASTKSDFILPLFSDTGAGFKLADTEVNNNVSIAARTAATDPTYDTVLDGSTTQVEIVDDSRATSNANTNSTDTTTTNVNANSNTTVEAQQTDYASFQSDQAKREIYADISAAFSNEGSEAIFRIKKVNGFTDISVKNQGNQFWVNGDTIKFNTAATADNWLEYTPSALKGTTAEKLFINSVPKVTIQGSRLSNEIVGGVRCYKYSFNGTDLDSFLSAMGITAKVESVSGDVWIGIADKLIRRINLKVNGDVNNMTSLSMTLDFYDYNQANNFTKPGTDQTFAIAPAVVATNQNANTNSVNANTNSTTTNSATLTNDEQRKADLAKVKAALTSYYAAKSSYPIAKNYTSLSSTGNVVASAIVPGYLNAMPADPNAANGWFYAYKSMDGTSFTLSTKLDSTTDSQLINVGGTYLYVVNSSAAVSESQSSVNDTTRKANLATIKTGLANFKDTTGSYPIATELTKLYIQNNPVFLSLVPTYMSTIPTDPKSSVGWYYAYKSTDGKSFSLSARLENVSDSQAQTVGGVALYYVYNDEEVLPSLDSTSDTTDTGQNGYNFY